MYISTVEPIIIRLFNISSLNKTYAVNSSFNVGYIFQQKQTYVAYLVYEHREVGFSHRMCFLDPPLHRNCREVVELRTADSASG